MKRTYLFNSFCVIRDFCPIYINSIINVGVVPTVGKCTAFIHSVFGDPVDIRYHLIDLLNSLVVNVPHVLNIRDIGQVCNILVNIGHVLYIANIDDFILINGGGNTGSLDNLFQNISPGFLVDNTP